MVKNCFSYIFPHDVVIDYVYGDSAYNAILIISLRIKTNIEH